MSRRAGRSRRCRRRRRRICSTYVTNGFWNGIVNTDSEPFFPGLVAIVGGLLALLVWRRWWVWFAAALTVVAAVLSFGFDVESGGRSVQMPYWLIYELVPPIRDIRGVGRFGLLTALGLPLLAAFGYSAALAAAAWPCWRVRRADRRRADGDAGDLRLRRAARSGPD